MTTEVQGGSGQRILLVKAPSGVTSMKDSGRFPICTVSIGSITKKIRCGRNPLREQLARFGGAQRQLDKAPQREDADVRQRAFRGVGQMARPLHERIAEQKPSGLLQVERPELVQDGRIELAEVIEGAEVGAELRVGPVDAGLLRVRLKLAAECPWAARAAQRLRRSAGQRQAATSRPAMNGASLARPLSAIVVTIGPPDIAHQDGPP